MKWQLTGTEGQNQVWRTRKISERTACRIVRKANQDPPSAVKDLQGDLADYGGVWNCSTIHPRWCIHGLHGRVVRKNFYYILATKFSISSLWNAQTSLMHWWGSNRPLTVMRKCMCGEQRARESGKRTSVGPLRGWIHHAFGSCCHRWPVERFTGREEWILHIDKDPEHITKSMMDRLKRWKLKVLKERISNNPSNKNLKSPTKCRWICRWQRWSDHLFVLHRSKQAWKKSTMIPSVTV